MRRRVSTGESHRSSAAGSTLTQMGPLAGLRVIELAGIGPTPYAAMLLGDLGADVIRVDRPGKGGLAGLGRVTCRSRRSIGVNLKNPSGVEVVLDLIAGADVMIEGMRPGVAERLGIGPGPCLVRNPRLVYGRMTGWGQEGPHRDRAGHDIDYIAMSGVLGAIGTADGKPVVPLNLIGDFGGGSLFLVLGVLAAVLECRSSGNGQVVDAAMVDGAASLMTMFYELRAGGWWDGDRGLNLLDGGAPFYDTYETADGGWLAVGALEPQFFATLLRLIGLDAFPVDRQFDRRSWPDLRRQLTDLFQTRSRDDWMEVFADSDACVWPVLSMDEAQRDPSNRARGLFVEVDGSAQPAPAPRFSRTSPEKPSPTPGPGVHTAAVLRQLGYGDDRIQRLHETGAVFGPGLESG